MKDNKREICNQRIKVLKDYCLSRNIKCVEFSSNAFRLNYLDKILDYYPLSNKCFWHSDKIWGAVENIEAFLKFEYPM